MYQKLHILLYGVLCAALGVGLYLQLNKIWEQNRLPPFTLRQLAQDIELSREDLPQHAFLLNFWASWCVSCRVEHPFLVALGGSGIPVYGVNFRDRETDALRWLAQFGDPYEYSLFDPAGTFTMEPLNIDVLPQTLLVDARQRILYRHTGILDTAVWQEYFAPLWLNLQN